MTAVGASGGSPAGPASSGEVPGSGGAFRLDAWRRPMGPLAEGGWAGVVGGHGGASSLGPAPETRMGIQQLWHVVPVPRAACPGALVRKQLGKENSLSCEPGP